MVLDSSTGFSARILLESRRAGGAVVAAAVFDNPDNRERIEQSARDIDAPFTGIWLDVPPERLRTRVLQRAQGVSDATGGSR
jgi:predicted kinase